MKCKKGYKKVGDRCNKKRSYPKNDGPVNINNMWMFIIGFGIFLLAVAIFYGGSQGWFQNLSVIETGDLADFLDHPTGDMQRTCALSLNPQTIYVGDRVTGTITNGANSLCRVFANDGSSWVKVYEGYTDSIGVLSDTRNINTAGDFIFKAICDLNGNNRIDTEDCLTATSELTVLPAPSDTICSEADGGNVITVPGITTFDGVGYMDYCLATDDRMVHEFWCEDGILQENNFMCADGSTCVDTRSGGYCQAPPEGYEVGDNVGSGSSGSGSAGFGDDDSINVITMDWTTGGDYVLGAKIIRSWNYVGEDCYGPEQYPMEWSLYDSNGMAWQSYDYLPVNNLVDYVCPVTYHEDAPWKFVVTTGIQACDIEYSWQVQPYICEANNQ